VTVATGAALDQGTKYENTTVVNVNIPAPVGAVRVDRIVLRKTWAPTQTVRIFRLAGVEGFPATALVQNDGVTWDIPLWQVAITVLSVMTLTDEREWLQPSVELETANYAEDSVDEAAQVPGTYIPLGGIIMWSGALGGAGSKFPLVAGQPDLSWRICDGTGGTPNLVDRFVVGAGNLYAVTAVGGALTHTHAVNFASDLGGSHNHGGWTGTRDTWANPVAGTGAVSIYTDTPAILHKHSISTDPHHQHGINGISGASSSLPPYFACYYIQRIA